MLVWLFSIYKLFGDIFEKYSYHQKYSHHQKDRCSEKSTFSCSFHWNSKSGTKEIQLPQSWLFGLPVLLSGLGTLYLLQSEVQTLALHYKQTLERLLWLQRATPDPIIFFIAGSLPLWSPGFQTMFSTTLPNIFRLGVQTQQNLGRYRLRIYAVYLGFLNL